MSQLTFDFTPDACDSPKATKPRSAKSLAAEAAFRERLTELGATLLEPRWLGSQRPHLVIDAAGHRCRARPGNVRAGYGFCKICVGHDPGVAEGKFRARLAELGATLIDPYKGTEVPHHVICANGHDTYPRPGNVRKRLGICKICAGNSPVTAEANFRAKLAELGCTPLFKEYTYSHQRHHCLCPEGHDCYPTPNCLARGQGPCLVCVTHDPATAAARFYSRVEKLGGSVVGEYKTATTPVHCVCAAGHDCYPRPHNLRLTTGICRLCARPEHSVFYVLEHEVQPVVKFGITNQDGRHRLSKHRRDGYTKQHFLVTELPLGVAKAAEDAVIAALDLAGHEPVKGWEYFNSAHLALILDVATSWLPTAI